MKRLFVLMLAVGLVSAASAQHARVVITTPGPGYGYGRDYGYNDRHFNEERRIREINREYDERIWSLAHDPYMSGHQKRRAIRELNFERRERIRVAGRWD